MLVASAIALAALLGPAGARASTCAVPSPPPLGSAALAALAASDRKGDVVAEAAWLVASGRLAEARARLRDPLESGGLPPESQALGWSLAALASAAQGEPDSAAPAVSRATSLLSGGIGDRSAASAWLALGWAQTELGSVPDTRRAFDSAASAAERAVNAEVAAVARVHRALLEGRIGADVATAASRAHESVSRLVDVRLRAELGVALGLALVAQGRPAGDADLLAHRILSAAYRDASSARDAASLANALGLLGELQLSRNDARGASTTLERAIAAARAVPDDPWRFRWSWKRGLALRATGEREAARANLQEAVELAEAAKSRRTLGRFSTSTLARDYRRAYLDLADELLRGDAGPDDLARARATMELSRTAEIEDFFRDPCVAARSAANPQPEALDETAAIVHPLLFDDRIELLVSHRSGLARFTSPRLAAEVAREVQRLRNAVERPGSGRYRASAEKLDAWLVAPLEAHLAKLGVKTLVWVPDGALRGLPFAALHDGKRHLVERYALAVTPVASLTDPRAASGSGVKAGLTGLTVAAQGFPALPGAAAELESLSAMLGVQPLRDAEFTVATLEDSVRRSPVNTLHVASHGQFAPEAGRTFLLASDGRFTLPQLRAALSAGKIREEPLDLLVLSACQTAAGDERAALGIAGVAIAAGARSALATLWAVSDESTGLAMTAFYRGLVSGSNRASALQRAQLDLLGDERFAHPFYWAPYLLVGSWH